MVIQNDVFLNAVTCSSSKETNCAPVVVKLFFCGGDGASSVRDLPLQSRSH